MLILERPWTRQPPTVVKAPPSAVFAWIGGQSFDTAGSQFANVTSASNTTNKLGRAIYTAGGTNLASVDRYSFPAARISGRVFATGKPTTIILQLNGINISSGLGIIAALGRPSLQACLFYLQASTSGNFVFGAHAGSFVTASWTGGGLTNEPQTLAITHDGGSVLRLVHKGVDYGTKTFASTAFPASVLGESLNIGAGNVSTGSDNFWGAQAEYSGMLLLSEMLPASQLVQITANPNGIWQLFAPRRIYIPTAAAAGYTHPTLSLATATEITASGFKPRVTYTFA